MIRDTRNPEVTEQVFFVDANFFLRVKPPDQLPWSEISSCSTVLVLVSRTVQTWIRRMQGTGRTIQGPAGRRLTAVTGLREMLTFG